MPVCACQDVLEGAVVVEAQAFGLGEVGKQKQDGQQEKSHVLATSIMGNFRDGKYYDASERRYSIEFTPAARE